MNINTTIEQYISSQPEDRQGILHSIHEIILEEDKTIAAAIEPMMGKEMIMYKNKGSMKYALAGVKNHMSLHVLPMYVSETLFSRYRFARCQSEQP